MIFTRSFYAWLKQEISFRKTPSYVLFIALLSIVISFAVIPIVTVIIGPLPELLTASDISWWMPFVIIEAAFTEELFFRGPLYSKLLQKTPLRLYISIVLLSVIFGLVHGTIGNIFIQGPTGILLSILFLKGGGLQRKFWKGIFTSAAAHALTNGILWLLTSSL